MATGQSVRSSDVYQHWKQRLDPFSEAELAQEVERLRYESNLYQKLLRPENEPSEGIRRGIRRINDWRGRTVYPFLLNVYRHYDAGNLSEEDFVRILQLIESFMVRRFFCGIPTNQLSRLFLRLHKQLPEGADLVKATHAELSDPGKRWPDDKAFREALLTFPLYSNGKPNQRRLVLETIARHTNGKESVNLGDLTIEHVMPRTLTPAWREMLGKDHEDIHETWIHQLANLTLTGYNSELSNSPFEKKRELLNESSLRMNRRIAEEERWTPAEMKARVEELWPLMRDIWPGPVRQGS
jgi:hypothetical protein